MNNPTLMNRVLLVLCAVLVVGAVVIGVVAYNTRVKTNEIDAQRRQDRVYAPVVGRVRWVH